MKPTHLIPPSRRVPVKRVIKPVSHRLAATVEFYYQQQLVKGYSTNEAATNTLAFVRGVLSNRLP